MSATATPHVAETVAPEPRPLSLTLQFVYGIGEIPITLTMAAFGIYVLLFYNSVMGLDGKLAGAGVTAGLIIDALIDPYIGFRSDASRRGLGRRQSYMLIGCLGMGPFFALLLSPPQHLSTAALFTWLLVTSLGFRLCFAVYRIPYLSLGAELTLDYNERTRVIAVRSLVGLAGMAAAALLPLFIFFRRVETGADPKLHYAGYPPMGFVFGIIMTVGGLIAVFGTQSCRTFGDGEHTGLAQIKNFFSGMACFLRLSDFRALWLAFVLCSIAVVVNFNLSLHFLKWYAGIEAHQGLSRIQGAFYLGAAGGVAGWIALAKRGEKRTFLIGSMAGLCAILAAAALVIGPGHLLGTGRAWPLVAGNLIAGAFASALWVLPFSMMADVVDEDALATGTRREGTCFGLLNFGEKVASGIAILISGFLLSEVIHLAPNQESQSRAVAARIGLAYGIAPCVLILGAIIAVAQFRLTRKRVDRIQAALEAAEPSHGSIVD